jgi:hypothetical protein
MRYHIDSLHHHVPLSQFRIVWTTSLPEGLTSGRWPSATTSPSAPMKVFWGFCALVHLVTAVNFTIIGGQIFTPGLAIVDAPQPFTPLGGGMSYMNSYIELLRFADMILQMFFTSQ